MDRSRILIFTIASYYLAACASVSLPPPGPRSITLHGKKLSENELGKFVTWACSDFVYDSGTLVELGFFADPELSGVGFVLYDGGNSGDVARHQRAGLNHRWNWGPNEVDFSFIIRPDGTGFYYDFSSVQAGEEQKAEDIYKCSQ